jgi:hypothetical protein
VSHGAKLQAARAAMQKGRRSSTGVGGLTGAAPRPRSAGSGQRSLHEQIARATQQHSRTPQPARHRAQPQQRGSDEENDVEQGRRTPSSSGSRPGGPRRSVLQPAGWHRAQEGSGGAGGGGGGQQGSSRRQQGILQSLAKAQRIADVQRSFRDEVYGGLSEPLHYRQDGFKNLGNSCYLAAVLHSLLRLPPFACDLRRCAEHLGSLPKDSLLSVLVDILVAIRSKGGVIQPAALKECVSRRSPQFADDEQHDAHEFLTELLESLEACVLQQSVSPPLATVVCANVVRAAPSLSSSAAAAAAAAAVARSAPRVQRCPTALNFRCVIEQRLTCCGCSATSARRELYVSPPHPPPCPNCLFPTPPPRSPHLLCPPPIQIARSR